MEQNNLNLSNYLLYLDIIISKLNRFFENQKEYIFCHQGCSKCCQNAQFPYTEIEFLLLMEGYKLLDKNFKKIVNDNIALTIENKKQHLLNSPNEKFRYTCPFLINNQCSVYNFRGIVCRSFGLMTFNMENKNSPAVPFCAYEGLNYSNVLDPKTNKISKEMYKDKNLKEEPIAFNADYYTLIDDEIAKSFDFIFGQTKPLIDWLKQETMFELNNSI